jgi:hypothetical protein
MNRMADTQTKRSYRISLILDSRGYDQDIEHLVAELKKEIESTGVTVTEDEGHTRRDFERITDKEHPGDFYATLVGEAESGDVNGKLQEHFRLEKRVKQVFVESL